MSLFDELECELSNCLTQIAYFPYFAVIFLFKFRLSLFFTFFFSTLIWRKFISSFHQGFVHSLKMQQASQRKFCLNTPVVIKILNIPCTFGIVDRFNKAVSSSAKHFGLCSFTYQIDLNNSSRLKRRLFEHWHQVGVFCCYPPLLEAF